MSLGHKPVVFFSLGSLLVFQLITTECLMMPTNLICKLRYHPVLFFPGEYVFRDPVFPCVRISDRNFGSTRKFCPMCSSEPFIASPLKARFNRGYPLSYLMFPEKTSQLPLNDVIPLSRVVIDSTSWTHTRQFQVIEIYFKVVDQTDMPTDSAPCTGRGVV